MSYNVFSTGILSDADKVVQNFYYIAQGDRLPYTATAAGSLTAADSVYNLGSSLFEWNNIYCNSTTVYGSLTAGNLLTRKLYFELTTPTTRIEITGLNGDQWNDFYIAGYIPELVATANNIKLTLNGISSASYCYLQTKLLTATTANTRITNTSFIIAQSYIAAGAIKLSTCSVHFDLIIRAKSGKQPIIQGEYKTYSTPLNALSDYFYSGVLDTTATITSMQFITDVINTLTTLKLRLWSFD